MTQTLYHSSNSPYGKYIKKESDCFYQASLQLQENKHLMSWLLFAFWQGLTPSKFFNNPEGPLKLIKTWKSAIFFSQPFDSEFSVSQNAWLDLKHKFNEYSKTLLLDYFNSLESSIGTIRFPEQKDLEFYLRKFGGSQALIIASILFEEEINDGDNDVIEAVKYLGMGMLWWNLLKHSSSLTEQGKLFIPLEDLKKFNCTEEDLLTNHVSKNIKDLTRYEFNKVEELMSLARRALSPNASGVMSTNNISYPKGLKEAITFLSNHFVEEMNSAWRSGWLLSSAALPAPKQAKSNWFIGGVVKLPGGIRK
ncbi:MAG: squalene/phytoene synthase family protein [Candidatus Caenarcaniphilales bacterium]|nr:squalene/phytoene synthase family protein [Candidatus Caenarcaniphilales bacterium]